MNDALLRTPSVSVFDYRCTATPDVAPFEETHETHSLSFVRRGSFGCRVGSARHVLVSGGCFVIRPGVGYTCTHDHHDEGDECLSFHFSESAADEIGPGALWDQVSAPPIASLGIYGARAQAIAEGEAGVGLDEAGFLFAEMFAALCAQRDIAPAKPNAPEARRAVSAAHWIEAHAGENITLDAAARVGGWSPHHFLRVFAAIIGMTPHQYLIAARLRRAAALLSATDRPITDIALDAGFADLSNFVRTFRKAAGVSPRAFRALPKADRNFLQVSRLQAR